MSRRARPWRRSTGAGLAVLLWTAAGGSAGSVDTSFIYQGQLKRAGVPFTGGCDFRFSVWENPTDDSPSSQVGPTLTFVGSEIVSVVGGLFTQRLDFGEGVFDGNDRYLEIAVRCPPAVEFTVLTPRQTLTATPHALYARETSWYGVLHVPPDIADGDDDTRLSESQVEDYLTNGPVDLALGTTLNGQPLSTGSHTVDTNAATRCNGAEVFLDGDGNCVSVDATGSSLWWRTKGGHIYRPVGFVGIGTDNPTSHLDIWSDWQSLTRLIIGNLTSNQQFHLQVNGSHLANEGRAGNFEIWGVLPAGATNVFTATPDGDVGIGDTTPIEKLSVAGRVKSTSGGFVFPDGTLQTTAAVDSESPWRSNGGSIYYNSGRVGIGTNAPPLTLAINTGLTNVTGLTLSNTSTDRTVILQVNGSQHALTGRAGNFEIYTADSTSSKNVFTVTPNANVGIGTTNPSTTLDVAGLARVQGDDWPSDGSGLELAYDATQHRGFIQVYDRGTDAWGDLYLGDGKVGIGKKAPAYPLHIGTNSTNGNGAHVTVGGVWTNGSDRNSKRNIRPIDTRLILETVVELPVTQWQYKGEPDDVQHIGPMAQDFYAAFKLGDSDKHIGTIDADGVALAAIQALDRRMKEQEAKFDATLAEKDARIADLSARLARLERILTD